jgi:hypothetical protein
MMTIRILRLIPRKGRPYAGRSTRLLTRAVLRSHAEAVVGSFSETRAKNDVYEESYVRALKATGLLESSSNDGAFDKFKVETSISRRAR